MDKGFIDIGSMKISEEDVIHIRGGLIGMPELKRFVLMDFDEESPFHWFQSLDDQRIGFVVSDPTLFTDDYTVTLDKRVQEVLEIERDDDLVVMIVVTVREEDRDVTGNLLGPIVVNATKRIGCQVVLDGSDYSPRQKMKDTISTSSRAKVEVTV